MRFLASNLVYPVMMERVKLVGTAATKKVFISFDFNHDRNLKNVLIAQSKNSTAPFEFTDCSLKEEYRSHDWKDKAWSAIQNCDIVIVVLGQHTDRASGVSEEIRIAQKLSKPIFQLKPRGAPDTSVSGAGSVIPWTWNNLESILS